MDIYSPAEGSVTEIDGRRKPTILYIFGGGFMEGNRRDGTAMEWFEDMTGDGYGVVAIDYRLGLKGVRGVTATELHCLVGQGDTPCCGGFVQCHIVFDRA